MSEKGANIDLLFRNGLKDYEVLPPPGVWDGIHPAIKIKSRQVIFLRVAAVAAILLTVSFLTYRWSRSITADSVSVMSFNVPASEPVISLPYVNHADLTAVKSDKAEKAPVAVNEPDITNSVSENIEEVSSPGTLIRLPETRSLTLANKSSGFKPALVTPVSSSQSSHSTLNYQDLQYLSDNIPVKPVNRWSIAAMASPTYYSGINSGSDALSNQIISSDEPLFSYSGGLSFSYKISKRFSIQSGLYYSSLGQKLDGINSYSGFQQYSSSKGGHNFEVLTSTGTVYTSNPDVFLLSSGSDRVLTAYTKDVFDPNKASLQPVNNSLNQNFSYLEFPVILRYKLIDKTIGINLIGGLSYNLLVHNSVYTTLDGNIYPVGDTKGLNPLSLSSSLGMGMEYNVSSKLSLNLEPTFRYFLNPFSVTTGTYIHPYSFGIFSGVSYKF
jgi:hypothetical protein